MHVGEMTAPAACCVKSVQRAIQSRLYFQLTIKIARISQSSLALLRVRAHRADLPGGHHPGATGGAAGGAGRVVGGGGWPCQAELAAEHCRALRLDESQRSCGRRGAWERRHGERAVMCLLCRRRSSFDRSSTAPRPHPRANRYLCKRLGRPGANNLDIH